ncbi:MAG TPA: hypothetical protein VJ436_13205 [Anaerolineales bacterium]|nr:hypothetical protein [Anaerolineales bacterium]
MQADLYSELAKLFKETIEGHKQAFAETEGYDPDWPIWYAEQLHAPLSALLQAKFTRSELVYLLVRVEKERQLEAPGAEWTGYYARFFLERYD